MYESPITRIMGAIQEKTILGDENNLLYQVRQSVGYFVDKEELLKALNYDRDQYERGYRDGLAEHRWISVDDRLPEEAGRYLTTCDFNTSGRYVSIQVWDDGWGDCTDCVVAWMPLPECYKED